MNDPNWKKARICWPAFLMFGFYVTEVFTVKYQVCCFPCNLKSKSCTSILSWHIGYSAGLQFLEKESCYRIPKFDIYKVGDQGLMTEMSIAELREAVKRMKQWFVDEEERKRNEVRLRQMKVHFSKCTKCFHCVFLLFYPLGIWPPPLWLLKAALIDFTQNRNAKCWGILRGWWLECGKSRAHNTWARRHIKSAKTFLR